MYYSTEGTFCAECATTELDDMVGSDLTVDPPPENAIVSYEVQYEGPTLQCDNCGMDIEPEYREAEAE